MDFFSLMFKVAPALIMIFKLGIDPKEEEILELTEEQYEKLELGEDIDKSKKWYMWLPPKQAYESNEIMVMNEDDKEFLFEAARMIERYCQKSNKTFDNYDDKLKYAASVMPGEFSENTKYEKVKIKIIK
ncbi:MAG TPA: hypothetical protein DCP90_01785 [Clostridiales bacterium]|nr:MAG: hypothetical protein A2Y22_03405 [Clostridiales bacterium GWD2_32_59]HAN09325.1 hypothetical protein [Clostridiales bacterium]